MNRIWFTSDYHMGHRNIIGLCNRPFADVEEMEREIVARHNELVGADDEVYDLGDFAYRCKAEHASECLRTLNGRRTMLWGNHDKPLRQALRRGLLDDLVDSGKVIFIGDPDPRFQTGLRIVIEGWDEPGGGIPCRPLRSSGEGCPRDRGRRVRRHRPGVVGVPESRAVLRCGVSARLTRTGPAPATDSTSARR